MELTPHELSSRPTDYWRRWKKTAHVMRLQVSHPDSPPAEDKLRFVCMSDTHSLTSHMKNPVPDGDVFVHAGDFTRAGALSEVREFNAWLEKLPHKHKVVIAGNHELSFDPHTSGGILASRIQARGSKFGDTSSMCETQKQTVSSQEIKRELSNCTYLEDSSVKICGLKIYGSPWQPEFGGWAYNLERGQECLDKWNMIPDDTDVLITHSPPLGFGDLTISGVRAGCVDLLHSVQQRIKPKYHVYGHIHEGYGVRSDGKILFINASTCDINYLPCNPAVVFDVSIPNGHSRTG